MIILSLLHYFELDDDGVTCTNIGLIKENTVELLYFTQILFFFQIILALFLIIITFIKVYKHYIILKMS